MEYQLPPIKHNRKGFDALTSFYADTEGCFFEKIRIDMKKTTWFDADMCAAFGAILHKLGENLNTIVLLNINPKVETSLSKNNFLSHYGRAQLPDIWETAISYRRFSTGDVHRFVDYVEHELLHHDEIPTMSDMLLQKFSESIFEIFSNAAQHSDSVQGIFSCGQFFPDAGESISR